MVPCVVFHWLARRILTRAALGAQSRPGATQVGGANIARATGRAPRVGGALVAKAKNHVKIKVTRGASLK